MWFTLFVAALFFGVGWLCGWAHAKTDQTISGKYFDRDGNL